jgi:preprotein translocase subunit SecG
MDTMQKVVLIAHTFIALAIIALVLLQRGKGADAGAAFGSGASGTVFGARGSSNFFSRTTAILATIFFASSLTLAYMSSQRVEGPSSLIERAPVVQPAEDADVTTPGEGADTDLPPLEPEDAPDAGGAGTAEAELPALEPAGTEGGEDDTEGNP